MPPHTAFAQLTEPITCTSSTARKSVELHLSERLVTQDPGVGDKDVDAAPARGRLRDHRLDLLKSVTDAPFATASPPIASISLTTPSAAAEVPPLPSSAPPRSLTTSLAPRRANRSACCRPSPPPAPVTMATLPLKSIDGILAPARSRIVLSADRNGQASLLQAECRRTSGSAMTTCVSAPSFGARGSAPVPAFSQRKAGPKASDSPATPIPGVSG